MPATRGSRAKYWCFTLNNYTQEDMDRFRQFRDAISYIIYNKEVGDQGTLHLQGFISMKIRKRMTQMKALMPKAHLEVKQGSVAEAVHYCMKPVPECMCKHCVKARPQVADFTIFGVVPKEAYEAMRDKWEDWYQLAKAQRLDEIPKKILLRYHAAFKRIAQDNPEKPEDLDNLDNEWIVAPTGYGKSHYVREKYRDLYDKAPNKWFVGYRGEETILLDDLGPEQCKYLSWYIKRWADLYSFPMETKGGGRQIRPRRIVVTSQYTIEDCFEDWRVRDAVLRRFTVIELVHYRIRILEEVQTAHGIVRVHG